MLSFSHIRIFEKAGLTAKQMRIVAGVIDHILTECHAFNRDASVTSGVTERDGTVTERDNEHEQTVTSVTMSRDALRQRKRRAKLKNLEKSNGPVTASVTSGVTERDTDKNPAHIQIAPARVEDNLLTLEQQKESKKERKQVSKDRVASDESPSTSGVTHESFFKNKITWDAVTGKFSGYDFLMEAWGEGFPAVDLKKELAAAGAWLLANPANRKSNYARFLQSWLAKAQDRAPARGGGPPMQRGAPVDEPIEERMKRINKLREQGNL